MNDGCNECASFSLQNYRKKTIKLLHYIPGYYEHDPVDSENFKTQLKRNTPKHTRQTNTNRNELKVAGEHGIEEYTYHSADLDYELRRKNIIEV